MKTPPLESTAKEFPPRVWVFFCDATEIPFLTSKDGHGAKEFISLEEHKAILKEERAKVWDQCAEYIDRNINEYEQNGALEYFQENAKAERENR